MSELRAALVDTDVFSLLFVRRNSVDSRLGPWRELLTGRQVLISFQTRAEALAGGLADNWGARRSTELRAVLDHMPTIGVDHEVIDAHAALYAGCRRAGRALHGERHTGDRWVAACAISREIALLSGDRIFRDAPGLWLLDGDDDV